MTQSSSPPSSGIITGVQSSAQAVAATGHSLPVGFATVRCSVAAAATGVILAAPTNVLAGSSPQVTIINESATNSITFAASATSRVANGVSCVVAPLNAKTFWWNVGTSLWYPTA